MTSAGISSFAYVTYIRTTPEKLWSALTSPDLMPKYWFGAAMRTEWTVGAAWKLAFPDGRVADSGEILECDPPKRLVLKWRNEWSPEFNAEGFATCTIAVEPVQDAVKLSVLHVMERPESGLIGAVSGGWPRILSNLKSLLETGEVVLRG
jgi:uncharacterized protein YndB with AHSA1/START domain